MCSLGLFGLDGLLASASNCYPDLLPFHQQERAGSKTWHQQNPPVLNWKCQLTQVDLYSGLETVVVLVAAQLLCLYLR